MSEFHEIKKLVVQIGDAHKEHQLKTDERFKTIEDLLLANNLPFGQPVKAATNPAETKAFMQYVRNGDETEIKAMSAGSDPDGGYTLAPSVDAQIAKYLRNVSAMRQLARVIPVGGSEYQQVASRGGTTCAWVGETGARPQTGTPNLGVISVPTHELYAAPPITQKLLEDSNFDLENWLITELGETFGDEEADVFINGSGIAKPRGLFTYDVVSTADATREHDKFQYVPTGASGAFHTTKMDCLVNLVYSLKPRYRANASWLMSPEVLEEIRLMKEATSDKPLWEPSTQAGQPSMLLGYPVYEDENLPAIASNSLSVAFGDFSRAYTITDRITTLLRDPYTAKPYVLFYARKRVGGGAAADRRAVKFLKFAAS